MTKGKLRIALAAAAAVFGLAAAPATVRGGQIPFQISGNDVTATINLAGGVSAELKISFENVVGLNPTSLTISADLADPSVIAANLPPGGLVTLPAAFPVVVQVEPTSTGALTFSGVYAISLHTSNLTLQAQSPLRIYHSSDGAPFSDMTGFLQSGSVRAGGSGPGFSQFVIVSDARPIDAVIGEKFDAVDGILSADSGYIASGVLSDLQQQISQARSLYLAGATADASTAVEKFAATVKADSGSSIPDVWRSGDSAHPNVAGLLRSAADTLRFSLNFKTNLLP